MRDINGTGNIYFDDLFIHGIPYYSIMFYTMNGGLALINLIALPLLFYGSYINNGYHRNYRVSDRDHDIIFYFFRFKALFGSALWRATFLSIALERTAATLFNKNYEKSGSLWIALTLVLFSLILGASIPLDFFVVRTQFFVVIGIVAAVDFSCILVNLLKPISTPNAKLFLERRCKSVSLLFWSNKTMRKLEFVTQIILSQRYQIMENLRILHFITPLIIVGTIFDFLAILVDSLQTMIDFNTLLYYPLYYGINNLYVSTALILLFKYNIKARRRIVLLLSNKFQSRVESETVNITSFDGKPLVIIETPDTHFNQLTLFWENERK